MRVSIVSKAPGHPHDALEAGLRIATLLRLVTEVEQAAPEHVAAARGAQTAQRQPAGDSARHALTGADVALSTYWIAG